MVCRNKTTTTNLVSSFIIVSLHPSHHTHICYFHLLGRQKMFSSFFMFGLNVLNFFSLNNTFFFNFCKITSLPRGGKSFPKLFHATSNIWFPYLSHPNSTLKRWLIFHVIVFGIYSFLTYQAPKKHTKNHLCFLRFSNNY